MRGCDRQISDKHHRGWTYPATIHHMELLNFDRRQVLYPMVERLLGIGEETGGAKVPKSVGLPLDAGMDMGLAVMWNNQTDADLEGVTLQLAIGYFPRNIVPAPAGVLPFKVDVKNPPGALDAFDLAPAA